MIHYGKAAGILLAGLAAYAAYKYSRMNPQQKKEMTDNLRDQGKKIFDRFKSASRGTTTGPRFGEGSGYTA